MEAPRPSPNGNAESLTTDPIDNASILARVELCITRSEQAAKMAEQTHEIVAEIKTMVTSLASDHLEVRGGVPLTWRRRIALVAIAAAVGALAGGGTAFAFGAI